MRANIAAFAAIATLACNVLTSEAADDDVTSIRDEIQQLSESYEARIAELESRLDTMEMTEGRAVSSEGESASRATKNRRIFNNTFNSSDYYYGISIGVEDVGYQWGARFNFQLRPFYKRSQILENDYLIRQYREKKYLITLDIDCRFHEFV